MMGHFQHALLTLYTNETLLQAFCKDPGATLGNLSLTEREVRALKGVPFKELQSFQRSLRHKRLGFTKLILKRFNAIVLMPFWEDSPALAWGEAENPRILPITVSSARILKAIWRKRDTVSLASILAAYLEDRGARVADLFTLAKILYSNKLLGLPLVI